MDDAGIYTVKAINIEGEAKCESSLNILPSATNILMNIPPPTANIPMNFQPPTVNIPMNIQPPRMNIPMNIQPPMMNMPMNIQPLRMNIPMNIQPPTMHIPMNIQPSTMNITMAAQPNGFPPEFLQLFTDQQTFINSTIKFEARLIGTPPLNVKIQDKNKIFLKFLFPFRLIGYSMVHPYLVFKLIHVINNKFSMIYIR